jgi:hypothetical protein
VHRVRAHHEHRAGAHGPVRADVEAGDLGNLQGDGWVKSVAGVGSGQGV